jgi:hypothetical protein
MEKLKVKPAVGPTTVFTVYRPNNQNVQISGSNITVDIKNS